MDYKNAIKIQVLHDWILQLEMLKTEFSKVANFEVKRMIESHQEENERQSEVLVDYQH